MSATLQWLHDNAGNKVIQCTDCGALNKRTRSRCYRCGQERDSFMDQWCDSESLLKKIIGYEIDRYGPDTRVKC